MNTKKHIEFLRKCAAELEEITNRVQRQLQDTNREYEVEKSTYMFKVPDRCDRVIWRGSYLHLGSLEKAPDAAAEPPVEVSEPAPSIRIGHLTYSATPEVLAVVGRRFATLAHMTVMNPVMRGQTAAITAEFEELEKYVIERHDSPY